MAKYQGRIEKRRTSGRRAKSSRVSGLRPIIEGLENRQLLTVAINEFGGSAVLNMTAGITSFSDGNLYFTETGSLSSPSGAIGRITPSGAIQQFTTGLSAAGVPTGITMGPDSALWFTEYGGKSQGLPIGNSAIGRFDPVTDQITEFTVGLTPNSGPSQITTGPDGALWFTENTGNKIGRIDPTTKQITEFSTGLSANSQPVGITVGPDKNLWFAESNTDLIGRITTAGVITEFGAGIIPGNSAPTGITVGSDNNLWFTERGSASFPSGGIGRITVGGTITQFTAGLTPGSGPAGITAGPNGNLFFTEQASGFVGQITTQGAITEFRQNSPTSSPAVITQGPDGNLWFTELTGTHVDRITPLGVLTQFPKADALPGGSTPTGITPGPDGNLWFTLPGANAIGNISTSGQITQFSLGFKGRPNRITQGPDGALWFTEGPDIGSVGHIGRITPQGAFNEFPLLSSLPPTNYITLGPDGNLWFTESNGVGQITPQGSIQLFSTGIAAGGTSEGITTGPDGNLWFTVNRSSTGAASSVDRITPQGVVTEFPLADRNFAPADIVSGFGGKLYFTATNPAGTGEVFSVTTAGVMQVVVAVVGPLTGLVSGPDNRLYFLASGSNTFANLVYSFDSTGTLDRVPIPTPLSNPLTIAVGSDNNLWFTESFTNSNASNAQIGQEILPQSSVSASGAAPLNLTAGQLFSQVLTTFTDASLAANSTNFGAAIDYGDGSGITSGVVAPLSSGGFSVSGSHVYAAAGQFTITVTISNKAGQAAPVRLIANVATPPSNVVTNTNDTGPGSLRQAILNANQNAGSTITFAIPATLTSSSTGVATIVPLSPLPSLVNRTILDGTSQARFEGKPAGTVLIQVDGHRTANTSGLIFANGSAGSVLEGVSILGFAGNQVELDADNQALRDCYVGLPADPATASATTASSAGVLITGANAVVGGLNPTDRDVISGNGYHGILFTGPGATNGLVLGNYIGSDAAGRDPLGNVGDGIVAIKGAGGLTIKFNLIGGNDGNGVELFGSSGNTIAGNLIGVDVLGFNELDNEGSGICVDAGSNNNTIGGTAPGTTNIISDNDMTGVAIQSGSTGNVVENNRIGTVCTGEAAIGNGNAGILVSDSPRNQIGPGNLVSGNGAAQSGAGIWIDGTGSTGNLIFANKVGTNLEGDRAIPNTVVGIVVTQAPGNTIMDNQVSGNSSIGIEIANSSATTSPGSTGNIVQGNVVGLDVTGFKALGNGSNNAGVGLYVLNASGNTIGGPTLAQGNVISGNNFDGVELFGPGAANNLLQFNRIGTNGPGTGPCGNRVDGLVFDGTPTNTATSNYITSNGRNGVFISGSSDIHLQLDLIGVGVGGQALGNGGFGILIGNKSPGTTESGLQNFNNRLGPERNTDTSPASPSQSQQGSNPSVTGHGSGSASASATSKARHAVKIQPTTKSFGGRQLAKVNAKSKSRSKH